MPDNTNQNNKNIHQHTLIKAKFPAINITAGNNQPMNSIETSST
jgi:hypothetical protein